MWIYVRGLRITDQVQSFLKERGFLVDSLQRYDAAEILYTMRVTEDGYRALLANPELSGGDLIGDTPEKPF